MKKFNYAGVKFDRFDLNTCVQLALDAIQNKQRFVVAVPSTRMVTFAQKNTAYREYVNAADLSIPDSTSILLASKLTQTPLQERVTGPDFMLAICAQAAIRGYRVYLLGTTQETLQKMKRELKRLYPDLSVCGALPLPFGEIADMGTTEIINQINASKPDILFVGMSAPKQEYWIKEFKDSVNAYLFCGVGAAFDFISGNISRAPSILRSAGLEWFYRSIVDPKRKPSTPFRGLPVYAYRLFILFLINHKACMKRYIWFRSLFSEGYSGLLRNIFKSVFKTEKKLIWLNKEEQGIRTTAGFECKEVDDDTLSVIQFDRTINDINKFKNIVALPQKCFCVCRNGRLKKLGWVYFAGRSSYRLAHGEAFVEVSFGHGPSKAYDDLKALLSYIVYRMNTEGITSIYCASDPYNQPANQLLASLGFEMSKAQKRCYLFGTAIKSSKMDQ